MRKLIYTLLLFGIANVSLTAQKKWSLRECIDYAIENNIDVQQRIIAMRNAEIDLNSSKNERLPDLNGSASQSFNFGRSQLSDGTYKSINSNSTSFGVNASVPLFTGFRITHNIAAQKFTLLSSIEELEKTKNNIELNITALYLDILFKKEIEGVYEQQVSSTALQLEKTKELVNSGKVAKSQEYDMIAQLAKDEVNLTMARNDLAISMLNLSQALNLMSDVDFDIVKPNYNNINHIDKNLLLSPDEIYAVAVKVRPYTKGAEYDVEARKKYLGVAKSSYFPTLSLSGGYSTNFNNKGNDAFFRQLKNLGSEYISLNLSVPIFNKFQTRNQVRSARLSIEASELNLLNMQQSLYKEIQQAFLQASSAQIKYKATEKALKAAHEAYEYAVIRYDIGQFTAFELNETQMKLTLSKSEMIQAKYDYIFKNKILNFYQGEEIYL